MKDCLIIGAGFFGLYLAEYLSGKGHRVSIIESQAEPMTQASYVNQARVHNGYHYPRSTLTALRSRISFPRFCKEFEPAIYDDFEKYYMIPRKLNKISVRQFISFCNRIGAPLDPAPYSVQKLTNPDLVEASFRTHEVAFDSVKLKEIMLRRTRGKVAFHYGTAAQKLQRVGKKLVLSCLSQTQATPLTMEADHVFNCTYSNINFLLSNSQLHLIPLNHEVTEMCLVQPPAPLQKIGLTLMCGPFFSVMPFPSTEYHSFSHVRYTPHKSWHENQDSGILAAEIEAFKSELKSSFRYMVADAARYIPSLCECGYKESIWTTKSILPLSDRTDSRPILIKPNYGMEGFHCLLGGKIDNVYDIAEWIDQENLV